MSENPYTPPSADLGSQAFERGPGTGDVDIGQCLSDAWAACWENFPLWLGVGLVGTVAGLLAMVTILGIPLLLPHLIWGSYRFVLNMHDGRAEFGDLFAGFARYTTVLAAVLIAGVALFALSLLVQSVQILGAALDSQVVLGLSYFVSFAFAFFVSPRLMLGFFYMVDQDMGGIEALQAAWSATARLRWWIFPLLVLLNYVIAIAGLLVLVVGIIPAIAITYLLWASAYRQLEGHPAGA
jgi:hypothetical protein